MAIGDYLSDCVQFTTKKTSDEIGTEIERIFAKSFNNNSQSERFVPGNFLEDVGLRRMEEKPAVFKFVVTGNKLMTAWAVQILVYERDNDCLVELIALGQKGSVMWSSANNKMLKMATSIQERDRIAGLMARLR